MFGGMARWWKDGWMDGWWLIWMGRVADGQRKWFKTQEALYQKEPWPHYLMPFRWPTSMSPADPNYIIMVWHHHGVTSSLCDATIVFVWRYHNVRWAKRRGLLPNNRLFSNGWFVSQLRPLPQSLASCDTWMVGRVRLTARWSNQSGADSTTVTNHGQPGRICFLPLSNGLSHTVLYCPNCFDDVLMLYWLSIDMYWYSIDNTRYSILSINVFRIYE